MKFQQIALLLTAVCILSACGAWTTTDTNTGSQATQTNTGETLQTNTWSQMAKYQAPSLEDGDIVATIKTNNGTMKLKLFTEKTPKTTWNFIALSKKWYYDSLIFHRVIPNFMIQWGDPEWTGTWGESIYGAKFEDEFHPELKNIRGTISMANAGPNTNGSQFFINVKDNNFLDNKHSVFGQVVEGMDIADKISKVKTGANDKPETDIQMISTVIQEYKGGKLVDYDFDLEGMMKKIEEEKAARLEANKSRVVVATDTVLVHYKWTLEDGSVFDESYERGQPIEVAIDKWQVIPGFGNALVGMKIGEKKSITLSPADAYGEYDEERTQEFPLADLAAQWITPEVWGTVPSMMWELKVLAVSDDMVTLDVNHPLAGKTLNFDLEIVDFVN